MDGIDRDHFLDYSAKSKILHFCRTLSSCKGAAHRGGPPTIDTRSIVPSDPLVGGLPAGGRARIRGSMAGPSSRATWILVSPRVDPSSSVVRSRIPSEGLVETRRLELLTLSLQRRRSAN
jgi:hypothetical protein